MDHGMDGSKKYVSLCVLKSITFALKSLMTLAHLTGKQNLLLTLVVLVGLAFCAFTVFVL